MQPEVGVELVAAQVELGEQRVLLEGVVGDQVSAGQDFRDRLALLVVAAEQEEDLGLEGVALPVAVEVGQEGILLERLEEQLGGKHRLEQPGQGGLADTDDTFDGQIHAFFPVLARRRAASWPRRPAEGARRCACGDGVWTIG